MDYREKIKTFAETVKQKGYDCVRCEDEADFVDWFGEQFNRFPNYVNAVVNYCNTSILASATMEGQEYRDYMKSVDRLRKDAHDTCIDAVNILNRNFEAAGLPPFADIDTTSRDKVAKLAGDFTMQMFDRETGGNMDKAVEKAKKQVGGHYPTNLERALAAAAELKGGEDEIENDFGMGL